MPHRKMSREEHDETIASISTGVAYVIKLGKIIIPILVAIVGAIIWIGLKAVSLNEWQQSLVKRPEFNKERFERRAVDSTLNAKIDTAYRRIETRPVLRFTRVIQRNGKYIEIN